MIRILSCLSILTIVLLTAFTGVQAQCPRTKVVDDYNNIYLPSALSVSELAWTGSTATCTPGTISALAQTRTLTRINYFRQLVGLPAIAPFDATLNAKCQQAALMMLANNQLSHSPPSTWLCYTTDGAAAAANSNLALGFFGTDAISGYMDDAGAGNTRVGHRRWILNSRAGTFGHGTTGTADALWVIGSTGTSAVNYHTYPSEGFFPAPLVPSSQRWSFSKAAADFSSAVIEMTNPSGVPLTVVLEPVATGYGDNTIVWRPTGVVTTSQTDVKYTIKVKNVLVNSVSTNFTYTVTLCQPGSPPVCPSGKKWSEASCSCINATGLGDAPSLMAGVLIANPFTTTLTIGIPQEMGEMPAVVVRNTCGQVVAMQRPEKGSSRESIHIPADSWAAGLYLVEITNSGGERKVIRAVKQ